MSTRGPILEQWIAQTIQSYPSAAVAFLSGESDPFRNPVGHTVRQCLTVLFDQESIASCTGVKPCVK